MKTSLFISKFRTLCDELEKTNAEQDSNNFTQSLNSVAVAWDMPELNHLTQG